MSKSRCTTPTSVLALLKLTIRASLWLAFLNEPVVDMTETGGSGFGAKSADRRRLTALVHMDMVGYSKPMSLDDVGTLRRLQSLRRDLIDPAIEEHSGRLVNTRGDSLLIAFDSIEGAVQYLCSRGSHERAGYDQACVAP
jgi:class 3 adenylate cyclase